jgi:cytochrome P450
MEQLRHDPAGLSPAATEEILRVSAVTMHFRRTATEEVEMSGKVIHPGDRVVMWYPSANHDEEVFERPFDFDIRRRPNDHLTFGTGRHVCLGAALARLEARVVLEELLARHPAWDLPEPPVIEPSSLVHGPAALALVLTPTA